MRLSVCHEAHGALRDSWQARNITASYEAHGISRDPRHATSPTGINETHRGPIHGDQNTKTTVVGSSESDLSPRSDPQWSDP